MTEAYPDYAMHRYELGERAVNGLPFGIGMILDEQGEGCRVIGGLIALDGKRYSVNVQTPQEVAELEALKAETGGYAVVTGRIADQCWKQSGIEFQFIIGKLSPCHYLDDDEFGFRGLVTVARFGERYAEGSIFLGAIRQVIAERRPCRLCDTPVSAETFGCAVVATPYHEGPSRTVNGVNIAVCTECDTRDDRKLGAVLAYDLRKDPALRARVHSSGSDQARRAALEAATELAAERQAERRKAKAKAARQARKRKP